MKPKHQRLLLVVASVVALCVAALLVMKAFREHIIFFYTPSEITQTTPRRDGLVQTQQFFRLGGLVKQGSIAHGQGQEMRFIVTDGQAETTVDYTGMAPTLFREGQGVVAEGVLHADGTFRAERILAKHDENYMPREVAEKLKANGHWHGEEK